MLAKYGLTYTDDECCNAYIEEVEDGEDINPLLKELEERRENAKHYNEMLKLLAKS